MGMMLSMAVASLISIMRATESSGIDPPLPHKTTNSPFEIKDLNCFANMVEGDVVADSFRCREIAFAGRRKYESNPIVDSSLDTRLCGVGIVQGQEMWMLMLSNSLILVVFVLVVAVSIGCCCRCLSCVRKHLKRQYLTDQKVVNWKNWLKNYG